MDGNSISSSSDQATSSLNSESRCPSQGIIDNMAETIADDKKKSARCGIPHWLVVFIFFLVYAGLYTSIIILITPTDLQIKSKKETNNLEKHLNTTVLFRN